MKQSTAKQLQAMGLKVAEGGHNYQAMAEQMASKTGGELHKWEVKEHDGSQYMEIWMSYRSHERAAPPSFTFKIGPDGEMKQDQDAYKWWDEEPTIAGSGEAGNEDDLENSGILPGIEPVKRNGPEYTDDDIEQMLDEEYAEYKRNPHRNKP